MEHIVGIKIQDKILGVVGFMTWGRIFHPIDPEELLNIVVKHTPKFGILHIESIELCDNLQGVANQPYFYEALFEFSHNFNQSNDNYKKWKATIKKSIKKGENIYFLGLTPKQKLKAKKSLEGTLSHGLWSHGF